MHAEIKFYNAGEERPDDDEEEDEINEPKISLNKREQIDKKVPEIN